MELRFLKLGLLLAATGIMTPGLAAKPEGLYSETITVTARRDRQDDIRIEDSIPNMADTAGLVARLPGAALVGNGSLSGQVQYRGAYGYRVGTRINGQSFRSGGPNLMDPPMHYAPPTLVETIKVSRGTSSLSFGPSLSAGVDARLKQVDYSESSSLESRFDLTLIGRSADSSHAAGFMGGVASDSLKAYGYYSDEEGSDLGYPDGNIENTFHDRRVYGAGIGFRSGDSSWELELRRQDTGPTGNPPFAMDIDYVETDFARMKYETLLSTTHMTVSLGYSDVAHGMNNFDHRLPPSSMMRFRENNTAAENLNFAMGFVTPFDNGDLEYGLDIEAGEHTARITNPNNADFMVTQVPDVEQERAGTYLNWRGTLSVGGYEAGVRVDRYSDASGMAELGPALPMGPRMLANAFNNADRDWDDVAVDLLLRYWRPTDAGTWRFSLARKNRAPTYLERYAWLPTAASAGLADGNNYVGNLELEVETAWILEAGIDLAGGSWWARPTLFFHQVDDYIQGVPYDDTPGTVDSPVEMVSMMNGDPTPLRFDNVDARMYGLDADYGWQLGERWRLEGVLSIVRGERRDISDDLYRISPDRLTLGLVYDRTSWSVRLEGEGIRQQSNVSDTNSEQETSGYGLVNLSASWQATDDIQVSGGIDNLFDRDYQQHLAGYNRVMGSDVTVGDRLPGVGRNLYVRFYYHR